MEPMMKKPSLFRRVVMNLVDGWRRVMDGYNLKYITIQFADILYVSFVYMWRCP